jgi:hypothetical protein
LDHADAARGELLQRKRGMNCVDKNRFEREWTASEDCSSVQEKNCEKQGDESAR